MGMFHVEHGSAVKAPSARGATPSPRSRCATVPRGTGGLCPRGAAVVVSGGYVRMFPASYRDEMSFERPAPAARVRESCVGPSAEPCGLRGWAGWTQTGLCACVRPGVRIRVRTHACPVGTACFACVRGRESPGGAAGSPAQERMLASGCCCGFASRCFVMGDSSGTVPRGTGLSSRGGRHFLVQEVARTSLGSRHARDRAHRSPAVATGRIRCCRSGLATQPALGSGA